MEEAGFGVRRGTCGRRWIGNATKRDVNELNVKRLMQDRIAEGARFMLQRSRRSVVANGEEQE